MKKLLLLIVTILLFSVSCTPFDSCEFEDKLGIAVILDLKGVTKPVSDIHIYVFDASNRLYLHRYFESENELTSNRLYINNGKHTIIAVLNVGADFASRESFVTKASDDEVNNVMLDDFIAWLRGVEPQHPDMMSGMSREVVDHNQTTTIVIEIGLGASKITSQILHLNLSFTDGLVPNYNPLADGYNMRTVTEVYKKGTILRTYNHTKILNNSSLDLHLQPGEYDILMWADHTPIGSAKDYYYSTSSLRAVTFNEQMDYTSGVDSRNAFALRFKVTVTEQPVTEKNILLSTVFAKYQIITTDVDRYQGYIAASNHPQIEDLLVTISYQGFFPSSYDIYTGKPNNASVGIKHSSLLTDIAETTATIGSDYIFAENKDSYMIATVARKDTETKNKDSYVNATVTVAHKETGEVITNMPGVRVDHSRGNFTTIKAGYLTAGIVGQGISIDTRWEGVIDVYF